LNDETLTDRPIELTTNVEIEDAAVAWILELERAAGRDPIDVRGTGSPADVESPPRLIEIKAFGRSARGQDLWLEPSQVEEADRNPDFYVYVVDNVRQGDRGKFELRVLHGRQLRELLANRREHRYFTVPIPVAKYDEFPSGPP
jgi:hypothetical protein